MHGLVLGRLRIRSALPTDGKPYSISLERLGNGQNPVCFVEHLHYRRTFLDTLEIQEELPPWQPDRFRDQSSPFRDRVERHKPILPQHGQTDCAAILIQAGFVERYFNPV